MASARLRLSSPGMRALLTSGAVRAEMLRRAQSVATAARGSAPVDSGRYRDSIQADTVTTDRAEGRVTAHAPYSLIVEADTRNLGRSLDAAGS